MMKKLFLLITCAGVSVAHAQHMRHNNRSSMNPDRRTAEAHAPAATMNYKAPGVQGRTAAKTTATTFWGAETFGSGTTSTLPTGWTTGSMPGAIGTWKWTDVASTSTFTMGAMSSASASDGWMIFDSDAIGAAGGASSIPSGYLQSPAITACAAEASVRLNFQNYFRNFYDSCSIWVCTNSSFTPGTYSVYPVHYNNLLPVNEYSPNPIDVHVNISGAAAMQPTVYIRFVYYGYAGGSYSWMIDDITLSNMDPIDGALDKASALYWSGANAGWAAAGAKPKHLQDTVYPVALVTNYGATGFPTAAVNAKIFQGSTNVYDQSVNVALPVDAVDTVADFTSVGTPPGYYSTTPGTYTIPFSINLTGDAVTSNDADTTVIAITDSIWMQNTLNAAFKGGAYVHRNSPALSFSPASGFTMSAGMSDTVTSVSVAFDDGTAAGQIVGVQIYHFDAASTSWQFDAVTTFHALAASEISTSTTINWATFPIDIAATGSHLILDGSTDGTTYAAVVKGQSNTADVIILTTAAPAANGLIGYSAYSDTSLNDGPATQQFGQDGLPYGNANVPMISLNFGNVTSTGVNNVNVPAVALGKAMPNPANTVVNIPVTLAKDGEFAVTMSNAIGQVVATQKINARAGQATNATFTTGNLPAGIYLYTVSVDGHHVSGRVSVTH